MGAVTPEKTEYDNLVVEYFKSLGWAAFPVSAKRWCADVLAVKDQCLAVIEVKSSKEKSCWPVYDDCANLYRGFPGPNRTYLAASRQRVYGLPSFWNSRERLYAVTIAAQLYRYFHEFEWNACTYQRSPGSPPLSGVAFEKKPVLAIPSEYGTDLDTALNILKQQGDILCFAVSKTDRLAVAEFTYADPPPGGQP